MPPKPDCGLIGGGGILKEPMPKVGVGFWLLHADELLLFTAEDQSMVDDDVLVFEVRG